MLKSIRRRLTIQKQARHDLGTTPARFRMRDLIREAALSISRHPGRSLVTSIGTMLGAAAFVSTLGLASTVQQQVSATFDIRRATEVVVRPEGDLDLEWQQAARLDRLRRLNGVQAAGHRVLLDEAPISRALGVESHPTRIIGADPEALAVMAPHIVSGRTFDAFHEKQSIPVVLLAQPVAETLRVSRIGSAIFIQDQAYTVAGIFDDIGRRPEALLAAIMPATTAEKLAADLNGNVERDVVIATMQGSAQIVGEQATLALLPESPASLRAIAPPDPRTLRREVETDMVRATFVLSFVALTIGAISIGNSATAAIAARMAEIGLRRAVGGRPAHIFVQLLSETTVLGAFSGAVGACCGLLITAGVSLWQAWTPVIDLRLALLASAASALAGLVAGLWPASRAMRLHPIAALQR